MKTALQIDITFEQILSVVKQLPRQQKIMLTEELEKEAINTKLSRLLKTFKTKDLDLKTITEEVESVRQEIYLIKVIGAKYIEDYKIEFRFNDGKTKVIDFQDQLWGEIFDPLKNKEYFKNFKLNPFTIEWENGADFAPEFLYNYGESKQKKTTKPQHTS
jgi:hypothetical protein